MFTQKSIDELYDLKQKGEITWLEYLQQSEYSEEFTEWCTETGLSETEDTAFLFLEKKDFDSFYPDSTQNLQIAFL